MEGFQLSPGITPAITGVSVTLIPLALGVGAIVAGRKGFSVAMALSALGIGAWKIWTDYTDPPDVAVAAAGVLAALLWVVVEFRPILEGRGARVVTIVVGLAAFLLGAVKMLDFYDPFDLILADVAVLSGLALLVSAVRGRGNLRATRPNDSSVP